MSAAKTTSGPGFHIVYEDADLLVVHKGPDVLSVANNPSDDALPARLQKKLRARDGGNPQVFAVHRLDRNVSGLLLFAKSEAIRDAFIEQFKAGIPSRFYTAVLHKRLLESEGKIDKDLDTRGRQTVAVKRGKGAPALTRYRVKRFGPQCTLVEIELETGRKHQIRAHFAAIGHPLLGDKDFGGPEGFGFDRRRIALHAHRLEFKHPQSGKRLNIEDPTPATFDRPFAEYDRSERHPQKRRR